MPTNQNDNINAQVSIGGTLLSRAGFGTAIVADAAPMAERIRYYQDAASVAADLADSQITAAQAAHLIGALQETPRPARVGAARISTTAVAQVVTVTVGGTATVGDYVITINGDAYAYTAEALDANADIGEGLRTELAAADGVTITGATTSIVITADVAGTAFTVAVSAPTPGTLTPVTTTANVSIATELSAVADADGDWFALHLVSRNAAAILAASAWAESARKFHLAQTSDADVLASGSGDIASQLKALGYKYSKVCWYSVDATPFAFKAIAKQLTSSPDTETIPAFGAMQLVGLTVDDANISTTGKLNARAKYVLTYLSLLGVPATDSSAGATRMASGDFVDERIIASWLEARLNENLALQLLNLRAAGRKVPYTDRGFAQLGATARALLERGIELGHFEEAVDPATDARVSPYVLLPTRASVPQSQVEARDFSFEAGALFAGAVASVGLTVTVSSDLELITSLAINRL